MDFRHILPGTRCYYSYKDAQGKDLKEYGRVVTSDSYGFVMKFDKIWCPSLQTGTDGKIDSWRFDDGRYVTFLPHEFILDDIVCIISGPYQGTSGLLYAYEGDNLMVDVEHNAVPCKAKDLELVARKRLI